MATVVPTSEGTAVASSDGTTVSVTGVTGQSGDYLVAAVGWRGNQSTGITAPSASWTRQAIKNESTIITLAVYTLKLSGAPASSYTWTGPALGCAVGIVTIRGADSSQIADVAAAIINSGTDSAGAIINSAPASPSVTTVTDHSLVLYLAAISNATTFTDASPTSTTELIDFKKVAGTTNALAIAIKAYDATPAGATGTLTGATAGTGRWCAATFPVRAADAGGGGGGSGGTGSTGAGNTLRYLGIGGGSGGGHITGDSAAYQQDYLQCLRDILGPGAFVRVPCVATQATNGSGSYTFNDAAFKQVYDKASALGLRVLVELHYQASQATQVPKIFNWNGSQTTVSSTEEMTQYKAFVTQVAEKYGPGGTYTPAVTSTGWEKPWAYECW